MLGTVEVLLRKMPPSFHFTTLPRYGEQLVLTESFPLKIL